MVANGPNIVLPSGGKFTTSEVDGTVQLRTGTEWPESIRPESVVTAFDRICAEAGENYTAFKVKQDGKWIGTSYAQYHRDVRRAAKAFMALGLEQYHAVAVSGFNCPQWFVSAIGSIYAGGVVSRC